MKNKHILQLCLLTITDYPIPRMAIYIIISTTFDAIKLK